jgi:hypothetical protein
MRKNKQEPMIGIPIIFILLGILIKYGKMYFLIAGYNTMSKAEKEKVDIKGIATVFETPCLECQPSCFWVIL